MIYIKSIKQKQREKGNTTATEAQGSMANLRQKSQKYSIAGAQGEKKVAPQTTTSQEQTSGDNQLPTNNKGPITTPTTIVEEEAASGSGSIGTSTGKVQLQQTLGLWNGVSIIIGVIVGSGIFVSPKGVLEQTGSIGASLVVWSLCGLLSLLGALCFAELGTSISTSGGEYTYIRLAYGPLPSFLYLWVTVTVLMPCGNAVSALTFANYVLKPLYPDCAPPDNAIRLLSLAILLLLIYINCASVKASIRLQNSFTLAKVLALVVIIFYGLYYLFTGQADNWSSAEAIWADTQTSPPHLAQAFYAGFYTYSGWSALNCVTEEMKDPVRNMPRAIILSITTITLIYILTNVAYFAVLTRPEILASDAIAVTFGERVLTFAKWLMPISVALSTMGGLNGSIFAASRVLFAGARQGQLFSALSMVNPDHLTPIPSLIFLGAISSLYLITTEIMKLIHYMVFVEASFAALAVSTVLALRYKLPYLDRPLKVYALVPILYLIFSFLLIVLPIWTSPVEASIGTIILITGIPVYYLTAHWQEKPDSYQQAIDWSNRVTQKLTFSVTPTSDISIT